MLSNRQKLVLKAIIEEYVKTNEPVGSRTLSKRSELSFSPATLRNDMADLEDYGYLEKTHTSSGRIPSEKGYRLYVEEIIKEKDDETYVYIWALVESYYVQDGKLISNGGYSIPHKFIIKDNEIIDYKIPRDGSEYSKSIKEIFPLDIRNKLNDDLVDGNKIDNQVKEHYSYLQDDKISISIKEGTLTKKGITLIIKNNAKQNYFYGSQYYLEKEENGTFNVYEPKEILSWNDVLYSLKSNEQIEIEINWIIGYDELSNGKYRLVKKFTTEENITSSANVQENFYVEFEIK